MNGAFTSPTISLVATLTDVDSARAIATSVQAVVTNAGAIATYTQEASRRGLESVKGQRGTGDAAAGRPVSMVRAR